MPRRPFSLRLSRRPGLTAGLLLPALALATAAAAAPPRIERARLAAAADRTAYEAGSTVRLAAKLAIDAGWHTNSNRPTYDYLIPTSAEFGLPAGWPVAEVDYPPGEMKRFSFAEDALSVYEGEVVILATTRVPATAVEGELPARVSVTYQACDDRSCLPPVTTGAELALRIGTGGVAIGDPAFAARRPVAAAGATGLGLMLLVAAIGGLLLNAMPCVLPVLSLKVFGLVKSAGQGRSQVAGGALATAAGILLSFWGLALAAVLAKAAGRAVGWGIQFQQPGFVAFLTVVVVLFCLNLWGLFEIPLPGRLANLGGSGPREGLPGHLFSGLFATLMATPCSAPFLGTAVGFALGQQATAIFAIFTAVALGMASPYLLLAAFPGTARLLPRPGPWMETFKTVMGFLLAGAAVWLLYVLAGQVSAERVAFVELALLALALLVWLRRRATAGWLRPAAGLAAAAVAVLVIGLAAAGKGEAETRVGGAGGSGLLAWTVFDRAEAEQLTAEGRLVFVDVTADWCFTCKVNERLVLETPEIAAAFEQHGVVAMKADWTNRDEIIGDFLADHGRYGVPFYLLYRPNAAPHLFSEVLTKNAVLTALRDAAASRPDRLTELRGPAAD